MDFYINLKDINTLSPTEIDEIYNRLSVPGRNMRDEISKRYIERWPCEHESMTMALIHQNGLFVAWVGSRPFKEKFKGKMLDVQTVECFTDPELRRRGISQLGLQALISAGVINQDKPVAVYEKSVVKIAERCGCKFVVLCIA